MQFHQIDWPRWVPDEHATLAFVVCSGRILLIHKLRGLGEGKITGPGGKLEPGETAEACALRELEEELGVNAEGPEHAGELYFQFNSGYKLRVTVFRLAGCEGIPTATEEAIPLWVDLDAIPYDRMWADDRLWIPLMLAGTEFEGYFLFEGEAMLGSRVETR